MEFRVLRYFLAIARAGSFTNAANSLNITQPTLSRQMKDLEDELGQQLFVRGSHNVSLTADGMILCKRAEEIIDLLNKTKAEFSSAEKTISGDVYIGGGETHAMKLIAETIRELHKDYPKIRYHLYSGNAADVTERLDKGLLDFGILIQPTDLSKYNHTPFAVKDVWGVVMPKDCKLASKTYVTKQDLSDLPLICSRQVIQTASPQNEFLDWFGKDFENMNIVATYNLVFNAALLAEQQAGYVITIDKLVDTMDNNVCFRPLYPRLESSLDIVWKKHQIFSPAAKIFLDCLKEKIFLSDN